MKVSNIEEHGSSLTFQLKGASHSYANALRRAALRDVMVFAIDKVTFYENTSAMFDEYISHRIGLVPIRTPSKGYGETDEILFKVDEVGPKTVYSSGVVGSDKDVQVANEKIPIIKLGESQRLRLDCKAVLGLGARHAKFQPGIVSYDYDKDSFSFYVESFGQMPPREIINKALDSIREHVKDLQKEVKKL